MEGQSTQPGGDQEEHAYTNEEQTLFINWLKGFLNNQDLKGIQKYLVDYRDKNLKRGQTFGLVCLPMTNYKRDGVNGWMKYMLASFKKKTPILAFTFSPYKDRDVAENFDNNTAWKLDKRNWERAVNASKWWYNVWKIIKKQMAEYKKQFKDNDWLLLKHMIEQLWDHKQLNTLKSFKTYNHGYKDKKGEMTVKTFFGDEFNKSLWKPFSIFWQESSGGGKGALLDIFTTDTGLGDDIVLDFEADVEDEETSTTKKKKKGPYPKKRKFEPKGSMNTNEELDEDDDDNSILMDD